MGEIEIILDNLVEMRKNQRFDTQQMFDKLADLQVDVSEQIKSQREEFSVLLDSYQKETDLRIKEMEKRQNDFERNQERKELQLLRDRKSEEERSKKENKTWLIRLIVGTILTGVIGILLGKLL